MTRYASIVSTGRFLPEIEVTNDELRKRFAHLPEFVDKMEASSGIRCRWHAPEDWATSDVALPAARQALERAGLHARGRGPHHPRHGLAGLHHARHVGRAAAQAGRQERAGTFDIGCACASFPTGLATAAGIIATNPAIKTVLVVGVYLMHKLADADRPDDRSSTATAPAPRCSSRRDARAS